MTNHSDEFQHVEGNGYQGEGRARTETVLCSCGWKRAGDDYYWRDIRHAAWMDHIIGALLAEVASLRAQIGSEAQEPS